MFCPRCKAEYREGFSTCADCQISLVEDLENYQDIVEITHENADQSTEASKEPTQRRIVAEEGTLLCPKCHAEYRDDFEICAQCEVELKPEIFIEPKIHSVNKETEFIDLSKYSFHRDIAESNSVMLLESDDSAIIKRVIELLENAQIPFGLILPQDDSSDLGGILGETTPMENSFPQIVVEIQNEEKAIKVMCDDPSLGLTELPPELEGIFDEEEEDEKNI